MYYSPCPLPEMHKVTTNKLPLLNQVHRPVKETQKMQVIIFPKNENILALYTQSLVKALGLHGRYSLWKTHYAVILSETYNHIEKENQRLRIELPFNKSYTKHLPQIIKIASKS
jgi:hypothetical protein